MLHTKIISNRQVIINDKKYLYFASNSYLGLSTNPQFLRILVKGVQKYGSQIGISRKSNFKVSLYQEVEDYLKRWLRVEDAVVVSSGTVAGQIMTKIVIENGYDLYYAEDAHPSLWYNRKHFIENSFLMSPSKIIQLMKDYRTQKIAIAVNSTDPLHAKIINFDWLKNIPRSKDLLLIIDDSHGIGINGEEGEGLITYIRSINPSIKIAMVASMGKALGCQAGIIAGNKDILEYIKKSSHFISASPPAPSYMYAFLHSEQMRKKQINKLKTLKNSFNSDFIQKLTVTSEHTPIFCFKEPDNDLYEYLYSKKVIISHFPYPHSYSKSITRIIINANFNTEDILNLVKRISTYYKKKKITEIKSIRTRKPRTRKIK
ncbi:MAG: aminotransferase class I/II-fold pyridoxal phosphate-dependent enzyme [Chitinophagaceae bacterium]|nr:aminotransferase class I/II-fold pyridoxal phosphate-dependent enzyme [Chitinophagaceae bacterium]